ncbi:MAG: iron-sulfur cluster carrier protein ApbC [Rhodospirillaceae bacterium]
MARVTEEQVLTALRAIIDADRKADIVSLGMLSGLVVRDDAVTFAIEVDPARGAGAEPIRHAAEVAVKRLKGVKSVTAVLTAHRKAAEPQQGPSHHEHGPNCNHGPAHGHAHGHGPASAPAKPLVPGVGAIIAVASGKGGVGKSTTAVNLALALAVNGRRVGLLDADVYGPSLPRLLGIAGQKPEDNGQRLLPIEVFGIKAMSIGLLVAEDTPMIWRGPMVQNALQQMLRDVAWGELDVLVVDMPPGTGDAQLTMAQQVPLAGAVIVSTPQDIALLDARKGLAMFRRVDVPVLGIIENMSYFSCPNCGHRSEIFSHGGAQREAKRLGVEFLGEIPLDIVIRETSDQGRPIVMEQPESEHARSYRAIAARLWEQVAGPAVRTAPRIVVE